MTSRTRFGRSRFGGSPAALLLTSGALGLVAGLLLGWLVSALRPDDPAWVILLVFTAATAPCLAALAWVVLVDRDTLTDAPRDPDNSVESAWVDAAASGAFWDLFAALGLAAAALAVADNAGVRFSAGPVLAIVLLLAMLDVGTRYLLQKRANS